MRAHGPDTLLRIEAAVPCDAEMSAREIWQQLGGAKAWVFSTVRSVLYELEKRRRVTRLTVPTPRGVVNLYRRGR